MPTKLTLNETISFLNQLDKRIGELVKLRELNAVQERFYISDNREKVKEPQYNVVELDKRIVELQNWRFKIDAHIKSINAKTSIELEIPIDTLLAPLT